MARLILLPWLACLLNACEKKAESPPQAAVSASANATLATSAAAHASGSSSAAGNAPLAVRWSPQPFQLSYVQQRAGVPELCRIEGAEQLDELKRRLGYSTPATSLAALSAEYTSHHAEADGATARVVVEQCPSLPILALCQGSGLVVVYSLAQVEPQSVVCLLNNSEWSEDPAAIEAAKAASAR